MSPAPNNPARPSLAARLLEEKALTQTLSQAPAAIEQSGGLPREEAVPPVSLNPGSKTNTELMAAPIPVASSFPPLEDGLWDGLDTQRLKAVNEAAAAHRGILSSLLSRRAVEMSLNPASDADMQRAVVQGIERASTLMQETSAVLEIRKSAIASE